MKNAFDLTGKVALVTGAGQGIGLEIARTLSGAGAEIVVAEYKQDTGQSAVEEIKDAGRKALFAHVDVGDIESVKAMTEAVYNELGTVDILVNNAGVAHTSPVEETSLDAWHKLMNVNLHGVFYCSQSVGKRMLERGQGSIVNIASMSGLIVNDPQPQTAYNVSKAAVIMLTKSMAAEWAKRGVRVNSVSPGYIGTDLVQEVLAKNQAWQERWTSMTPAGHLGEPSDVAHAVWYLASDAAKFATGTNLVVDGGYTVW